MKLTFRWFDPDDPIPLSFVRQIPGMRGMVAALYDLAPDQAWPVSRLKAQREKFESAGFEYRVVESIPVHEDIKLGGPGRDQGTDVWIRSMKAVAEALGPRSAVTGSEDPVVITYNIMPVFDWTRSELARVLPDGSTALAYDAETVDRMDPLTGELELPGWLVRYTRDELARLLESYRSTPPETVYSNLVRFLRDVTPEAEKLGIRLALHPDDPPWPVFGIPRVMTGAGPLRRLFADVPSPANGLCLCAGSFGADPANDIPGLAKEFASRTYFAHLRNVAFTGPGSFCESGHWTGMGGLDMAAIVDALVSSGFDGPVRPDHGRMIWNEVVSAEADKPRHGQDHGPGPKPGYGLYDRALGAAYILGLFEQSERHSTGRHRSR